MSYPENLGTVEQILHGDGHDIPMEHHAWHQFRVRDSQEGARAARWAMESRRGRWTFRVDPGSVLFYIQDSRDAMLVKLTWNGHEK